MEKDKLAHVISENLKSDIDLPWKKMTGLRDIIAHEYFSLDLEAVWKTATEDVPDLAREIERHLSK